MAFDTEVLKGLIHNKDYTIRAIPYIKKEYFQHPPYGKVFGLIESFYKEYNGVPSIDALSIMVEDSDLNEKLHRDCVDTLQEIREAPETGPSGETHSAWLIDRTKEWIKDRALHNALMESISIYEKSADKEKSLQRTAIPDLFRDALAVDFDTDIGMDYFEDIEKQFQYYQHSEDNTNKMPFDIEVLNYITRGGIPRKTVNLVFAGVNVGKTAFLCYLAGMYLSQGYKVLFLSCEMSREMIRERIDANILGITTDNFYKIKEDNYVKRLKSIREKVTGELVIRDYPPLRSNSITYKNLLRELLFKKGFTPDVVLVDYLGIVASSSLPLSAMQNSNLYLGTVTKELKALATEGNFGLWSAHQLNREGMQQLEVQMTHSGGSIDITKDADFILSISQPEEMEEENKALFKQLKNRYNKKSRVRRFLLGMDTDLMRFHQLPADQQELLYEEKVRKNKKSQESKSDNNPLSTQQKPNSAKNVDVSDWNI